jgi:hypothetical protein
MNPAAGVTQERSRRKRRRWKMKKLIWTGAALAAVLSMPEQARAASTVLGAVTVTATVNARAKLTLGTATINFPDADPDVTPVFTSAAVPINVKARTAAGSTVSLTVKATDDLRSGASVIAINTLTWKVTGVGFSNGTSNKTTPQTLGSWNGSGNPSGTQTFSLPNSWSYATGSYSTTLSYTLTAP